MFFVAWKHILEKHHLLQRYSEVYIFRIFLIQDFIGGMLWFKIKYEFIHNTDIQDKDKEGHKNHEISFWKLSLYQKDQNTDQCFQQTWKTLKRKKIVIT